MSGLLAGLVWLSDLEPELKPLAATLADIANDDGTSIYPSVAYVAWRLGRSERHVQYGLQKLTGFGILEVVAHENGGRSNTVEYRLIRSKLPAREEWALIRKGAKCVKGANGDDKGCKVAQERVNPSAPYPLEEPSLELSSANADSLVSPTHEAKPGPPVSPGKLLEIWKRERGPLPDVRALTRSRKRKCEVRIAERGSDPEKFLAEFAQAVRLCASTPFLRGENDRGWKAGFDWLVGNDVNLEKVLEGKYAKSGRKSGTGSRTVRAESLAQSIPLRPSAI
ncbi:MAG: hypothetical protein ACYDA9_14080 [Terriglobia bacterium]